jgi:hypothetical protein
VYEVPKQIREAPVRPAGLIRLSGRARHFAFAMHSVSTRPVPLSTPRPQLWESAHAALSPAIHRNGWLIVLGLTAGVVPDLIAIRTGNSAWMGTGLMHRHQVFLLWTVLSFWSATVWSVWAAILVIRRRRPPGVRRHVRLILTVVSLIVVDLLMEQLALMMLGLRAEATTSQNSRSPTCCGASGSRCCRY